MTPNKVKHFQEWLSGLKKKPKSVPLMLIETLIELHDAGVKMGLTEKQTIEIINLSMNLGQTGE